MKYIFCFLFLGLLVFQSCNPAYQRVANGYEFMIIKNGNGQKPVYGNTIQYHIRQEYKNGEMDTLLSDSREYMVQTVAFDSMRVPLYYLSIINQAGNGDSIVIRISTDSMVKNGIRMPARLPQGGYLYTTIKLLNVFANADLADSAKRAELRINGLRVFNQLKKIKETEIDKNREKLESDSKIIRDYLDRNNIKYVRGNWGSFVSIQAEGTGEKIAYNDVVAVNYTGKTIDSGKVFDSNTDPKFNNPGAYEVTMGAIGTVLAGWTDALFLLKKGSRATVYLPSPLAFGKRSFPPLIKSNENVVYDIEVINVISEDRALEIVSENRRKAEAMKRRESDSLKLFR